VLIRVDTANTQALFQQIAAQIRGGIGRGEIAKGERLPAAREMADMIDVNVHTVLRAYQELANEGLIEMRRGRGVTVTADASQADITSIARSLIEHARRIGVGDNDIVKLVKGLL
jgi:GntR family transcriptional regulator